MPRRLGFERRRHGSVTEAALDLFCFHWAKLQTNGRLHMRRQTLARYGKYFADSYSFLKMEQLLCEAVFSFTEIVQAEQASSIGSHLYSVITKIIGYMIPKVALDFYTRKYIRMQVSEIRCPHNNFNLFSFLKSIYCI